MEIERKLADTDCESMGRWRELAQNTLINGWDFDQQVEIEAIILADYVICDISYLKELRQGVAWANAHDREAYERLGDLARDNIHGADRLEATARRLAHHAGRQALGCVGSRFKRTPFISRRTRYPDIELYKM